MIAQCAAKHRHEAARYLSSAVFGRYNDIA